MEENKGSPLQKLVEYNVTGGIGYDTQTPEYTGNIRAGFFRNCFRLIELIDHSDGQTYSLKAHLIHLEYQSMRPVVLDILDLLRKAPEDYMFRFKDGSENILSSQAREKERRGLLRRMKHFRQEREKHLRRDLEYKHVISWMSSMVNGLLMLNATQKEVSRNRRELT